MSLTLGSFPSSSAPRTISPAVSSMELLLPLKSKRWASSFCACCTALETSCISVFDTISKEKSWAMPASVLLLNDVHARRRCEVKEIGRDRTPGEAGKVERGLVAVAIRIGDALDGVRGRGDGDDDVANHGRGLAWLERGGHRTAARGLADDEMPLARRRIADDEKGKLAATLFVDR